MKASSVTPPPDWLKTFALAYLLGFWPAHWFYGQWKWFWWMTIAFPLFFFLTVMAVAAIHTEKNFDRKIAAERRQRGKLNAKHRTDYGRLRYPLIISTFGTASLFLAFFALFSVSSIHLSKGIFSKWWNSTTGRVLYTDIESFWSPEDSVRIKVGYAYTVDNKQYESTRVTFGYRIFSRYFAQEELKNYPVGSEVVVYYDSGDPRDAVLSPGVYGTLWILFGLVLGSSFTVAMTGLIFNLYKRDPDLRARLGEEINHSHN